MISLHAKYALVFFFLSIYNDLNKAIISDMLDRSLLMCRHGIHTSIAQRTLEKCYPRLALRSAARSSADSGENAVMEWLVSLFLLRLLFYSDYIGRISFVGFSVRLSGSPGFFK